MGNGTAGWVAASLLARALDTRQWQIELIGTAPVADSLGVALAVDYVSPRALERLALAGWDARRLIREAQGAAVLGTAFTDWSPRVTRFQPVGPAGAPLGAVAFHQLAARLRAMGRDVNFANYALGALCAQANRFALPDPDDRGVMSTLVYGLHLDSRALARAMQADALAHGVRHAAEATDRAATLQLDCTGPAMTARRPDNWHDWSAWLPLDRVAVGQSHSADSPVSYAQIVAHAAGWQRFSAVQGAVEDVFAYRSDAARTVAGVDDRAQLLRPGRLDTPWHGERVALGGAAAVIDPLFNHQLDALVASVVRLIELLPATENMTVEAAAYNRQTCAELDSARDVATTAYALSGVDAPMWQACRAHPLPEQLAYKLALFRSRGRVALYDDEVYDEPDWISLFEALGLHAAAYDAQANIPPIGQIDAHFARVREIMLDAVSRLPPHGQFLRMISS